MGSEVLGYLAVPHAAVSGPGPWPGVVVLHDITALGADLRAITDRFATAGYLALAPDLYSRGGRLRCLKAVFEALRAGQGQVPADIDCARAVPAERLHRTGCGGRVLHGWWVRPVGRL